MTPRLYDIIILLWKDLRTDMSMHRKTITLTEQQENWVKCQIESGHFGNDSEYIRHLIRQDQQAQERLLELRQALRQGEASGKSRPLDISAVKAAGRKRTKATN